MSSHEIFEAFRLTIEIVETAVCMENVDEKQDLEQEPFGCAQDKQEQGQEQEVKRL